jgi:hypothetical protein
MGERPRFDLTQAKYRHIQLGEWAFFRQTRSCIEAIVRSEPIFKAMSLYSFTHGFAAPGRRYKDGAKNSFG